MGRFAKSKKPANARSYRPGFSFFGPVDFVKSKKPTKTPSYRPSSFFLLNFFEKLSDERSFSRKFNKTGVKPLKRRHTVVLRPSSI